MSNPTAVVFVMLADGHFQRLRPLISELTGRGMTTYVFTGRRFETRAVEVLRDRYGLEDASPFCFMSGLSPLLNVYCEPAAYLTVFERRVFEPVAGLRPRGLFAGPRLPGPDGTVRGPRRDVD